MPPETSPAFQFYPKDFLSSSAVALMSMQERGVYITLLCHCWLDGSLPTDPERLARICGLPLPTFRKCWPAVSERFVTNDDGHLTNPRLERERHKQSDFRRRQSDNGRRGGRPRKLDESQALPAENPTLSSGLSQTEPEKSSSSAFAFASAKEQIPRARGSNPTDFKPEALSRVADFIERYKALYQKHRKGAHYLSNPQRDFPEAAMLCETWEDERLDKIATVFLTTDHEFAESGSRTLAQFWSLASWCDSRLVERGL